MGVADWAVRERRIRASSVKVKKVMTDMEMDLKLTAHFEMGRKRFVLTSKILLITGFQLETISATLQHLSAAQSPIDTMDKLRT